MQRTLWSLLVLSLWAAPVPAQEAPASGQDAPPKASIAKKVMAPPAIEVLERYTTEVGGEEAIRKHASRTARGTFSLAAQGIEGDILLHAEVPNRYYLQIDIPGLGLTRTGYDGEVGWIIQPMMGPMLLEDEALAQLRDEADYYELIYDPSEFEVLENLGTAEIAGRPCWKIHMVRPSGFEVIEYFDEETGLLAAREGEQETPMGKLRVLTLVREHREFGGVQYPTVLEQELMGMTQVMSFTEVTFDDVPDDAFDLPAEIQVLLETPAGEAEPDR